LNHAPVVDIWFSLSVRKAGVLDVCASGMNSSLTPRCGLTMQR